MDALLELQKQMVAHFGPSPNAAWCVECAGNGQTLVTQQIVDHVCGGYETETGEPCEACDGTGRV